MNKNTQDNNLLSNANKDWQFGKDNPTFKMAGKPGDLFIYLFVCLFIYLFIYLLTLF